MIKIKNKKINIYKDKLKKNKFLKNEIKKIILKSIIQNNNLTLILKTRIAYLLSKFSRKSSISNQNNNICLKTGRIKGVHKKYGVSRHVIKKLGSTGNLQNVKIISW